MTEWHGSREESMALMGAIAHNCTCQPGAFMVRKTTCPPHQAMLDDQRFLDGLLMMRRYRGELEREEQTR